MYHHDKNKVQRGKVFTMSAPDSILVDKIERWLRDPGLLSSSAALLPETGNLWTLRTAKNVGTYAVRPALTRPFRGLVLLQALGKSTVNHQQCKRVWAY